MTVQAPDKLLAGLAEGMANDEGCLLAHFHYYPFGGFAKTAAYAKSVADGAIDLKPKGRFFRKRVKIGRAVPSFLK